MEMLGNARWAIMAALLVALLVGAGSGEAATDCTQALASVTGCRTFLTNPSSTPDQKSCCQPLQTVLTTPASFQCLCALVSSGSESGATANALMLPKACKLDINVSDANCSTTPSTTPSSSTSPSTANPNMTSAPGGSGAFMAASPFVTLIIVLSAAASFLP